MGRFAVVLVILLTCKLQGQENGTLLSRHVPSEFARTKLTLVEQDGLPVLFKGDRQLATRELFETMGKPQRFDAYNKLELSAQKYRRRSRWLHSIARFSAFGSLFFGASRFDDQSTTLHEWLPTIEMATFGTYAWFMARRYDYRAELIQKNQREILDELNLEQWVTEYNLQLYQRLIDSGLTFSE
ncbi:MAG: hypothetical protein K9N34_06490 [Candidatus Marinimicrobia bacterium]|nr:hypothetical protein [Candidatus Neomarinimicrobiota bacterium]MCF7840491.1 hypothetical protein [Candidatus Neomarinimicrobiota bacterium]